MLGVVLKALGAMERVGERGSVRSSAKPLSQAVGVGRGQWREGGLLVEAVLGSRRRQYGLWLIDSVSIDTKTHAHTGCLPCSRTRNRNEGVP